MEITIDSKKVELKFGVRFIRELDKTMAFNVNVSGQQLKFGMGLMRALLSLRTNDVATLSTVIYAAAYGNSPRPSQDDIDDYIDGLTATKLDKLFTDVVAEMDKSTQVQFTAKNMKAQIKLNKILRLPIVGLS